jgi:transcriptional regulator with XRE-family HTH domain
MDKDPSTLLRELKHSTGWSETRLARELKTSQPTVNRLLNGQPRCFSTLLTAIANLHEVHCTEALMRRSGDKEEVG